MTEVQEILLELEAPYAGHPYHVSGNALLHAVSDRMDYETQRKVEFSHGVFVPSVYGSFPEWHSKSRGRPSFGANLKEVEKYRDAFLFRRAHHPWITDSRPRDTFNTHDLKVQGDNPVMARSNHVQATGESASEKGWYIHFYVTGEAAPVDAGIFDGAQVGGKRNYGYGEVWSKDSQTFDTEELDYSDIRESDSHVVELVTPYVLSSEHPKTGEYDIPWWWDQDLEYRRRKEVVVEQREQYELETVDHGQVTAYEGDDPVLTAKKGIERIGNHSKYGFGEFMLRPA